MFLKKLLGWHKPNYSPITSTLLEEYNQHRPAGPQKYVCYAPFKSMYFGHHGRAMACCYNRTHVLGHYPQSSIKDIWFGEDANKLRDYIKQNDLSLGCNGCKQQLVAGNFDAVKTLQYDERTLNKNRYPSVMEFELSNVCNLECVMCNGDFSSLIRAKREKLPPLEVPYDNGFVEQLEEFIPYLDEVKFYGGEPFLIELYYQIWEKIIEINPRVRISVQTNATVLNNRVKRILEHIDFHINVSFDSLQKNTYENIRVNADFDRTLENLKWFREYCKNKNTFFGVSVCAMQQNWKELPDFINFCNRLQVPVYFHTVLYPSSCSIIEMEAEKLKEVCDYLDSFNFPESTSIEQKNKTHYNGIKNQISTWYKNAPDRKKTKTARPQSIVELQALLIAHITNDKSVEECSKSDRIKTAREKLDALNKLIDPARFSELTNDARMDDPFLLDNLALMVNTMTVEQLAETIKANYKH